MQGVLVLDSLAQRVRMPLLLREDSLEDGERTIPLQDMPLSGFRHRRDDLPGFASPFGGLVPRHVVRHQSENRSQRIGSAAGIGTGELQDVLDHAA